MIRQYFNILIWCNNFVILIGKLWSGRDCTKSFLKVNKYIGLSPEGKCDITPDGVQLIFLLFIVVSERKMEFQFWVGTSPEKIGQKAGGGWTVVKKVLQYTSFLNILIVLLKNFL